MTQRELKRYSEMLDGDVFIFEGVAYQKRSNGRAFEPKSKESRSLPFHAVVTHIGMGIWPAEPICLDPE